MFIISLCIKQLKVLICSFDIFYHLSMVIISFWLFRFVRFTRFPAPPGVTRLWPSSSPSVGEPRTPSCVSTIDVPSRSRYREPTPLRTVHVFCPSSGDIPMSSLLLLLSILSTTVFPHPWSNMFQNLLKVAFQKPKWDLLYPCVTLKLVSLWH